MKKIFISILLLLVLLIFTSCSINSKNNFDISSFIVYTLIDENNNFHSYKMNLIKKSSEEITVNGFTDIKNVKFTENGFYCFGEKGKLNYLLFVSGKEVKSFLLPSSITEFNEIFVYKGFPLFMSVDEATYNAVFYNVDFAKNELNTIFETENIPAKYIVINDRIILCENNLSVDLNDNVKYEYGIIKVFDGELKNVDTGFEPVAVGEDEFLYSKFENKRINTFCYSLKTNKSSSVDIHYIDDLYSLEKFEPNMCLFQNYALYYKDNVIYFLNTDKAKRIKIKSFQNATIVYLNCETRDGSMS